MLRGADFGRLQGMFVDDRPELKTVNDDDAFARLAYGEGIPLALLQAKLLSTMLHSVGFRQKLVKLAAPEPEVKSLPVNVSRRIQSKRKMATANVCTQVPRRLRVKTPGTPASTSVAVEEVAQEPKQGGDKPRRRRGGPRKEHQSHVHTSHIYVPDPHLGTGDSHLS